MKCIPTTEAVGHILCHDMTQIIPGVTKDARFRKGHIVTEEDIPVLLSMGKEQLYIWEKNEDSYHENEAAEILYDLCRNEHMEASEIKEGKIDLIATCDGLLKVDVKRLHTINRLGEVIIATRHNHFPVKKGDKLAGMRVIPLVIKKEKLEQAKALAGDTPLMGLLPYKEQKVGIVTTGSEVFHGRIQDAFGPVIRRKVEEYGAEVMGQRIVDDKEEQIKEAILKFKEEGASLIICTGGMSVDPDDVTPTAIVNSGAKLVSYGAPVLPGAMFLLAYTDEGIPILGLPGCVMYAKRTVFDLVLPRVMAGDVVTQDDLAALGHGGLCLNCGQCTFPNCSFGK